MSDEKKIEVVKLDKEAIIKYLNSKEFEDGVMETLKEIANNPHDNETKTP